jgi:hypothetical protein
MNRIEERKDRKNQGRNKIHTAAFTKLSCPVPTRIPGCTKVAPLFKLKDVKITSVLLYLKLKIKVIPLYLTFQKVELK